MFKIFKKMYFLLPLLVTGCSLRTTKSQVSFVSRRYMLSFATTGTKEEDISFVEINGLFKTGWSNPPTYCDFHYDGHYEEQIEYKKNIFETEKFSGSYVLEKNSKGQSIFSITRDNGTKLSAFENWPYKSIKPPQPYNILMGLPQSIYLSADATEKSEVTLWYISNVFLPYQFNE